MAKQPFDFVDDGRKKRIRDFLQRPIHQGGILLVAGTRGMGKTRLVDEALNERRPIFSWFEPRCWGGNSHNSRWSQLRKPRCMQRYILKVDVDPFFPTKHVTSAVGSGENSSTPYDKDELAFQVIRNIVFGLTSTIDPRLGTRNHGKTLTNVLGFRRYWLALNALSLPNMSNKAFVLLFFGLFLAFSWWQHWFYVRHVCKTLCDTAQIDILYAVVTYLIAWLLSFVILRLLDWRSVIKQSEHLYNLVNAYDTEETNRRESGRETKMPFKWRLSALIGLLAAGAASFLLCRHPELWKEIQQSNVIDIKNQKLLVLFLGGGGLLTMTWTFLYRHESVTHFNNKNPVWMIALLRRYLFLLHRCGIEPVLVFDELDKLEALQQTAKRQKPDRLDLHIKDLLRLKDGLTTEIDGIEPVRGLKELNNQEVLRQRQKPEILSAFIEALLRIKHALGTEFLWILVGGVGLHERLQQDRHNRDILGPLATLIQQDILLGPMSLAMAKNAPIQSTRPLAALWLRSHGNFSTLVRELPNSGNGNTSLLSLDDNKAENLANLIDEIWQPDKYSDYIGTQSMGGHYHLFDDWHQTWIHIGMLKLANILVTDNLGKEILTGPFLEGLLTTELDNYFKEHDPTYTPGVYDPRTANPATALQVGTAKVLMALGKFILYRHLQRAGKIQTAGNGAVRFVP